MIINSHTSAAQRAYSATIGRGVFSVSVTGVGPEADSASFAASVAGSGADFGKTILLVKASSLVEGPDVLISATHIKASAIKSNRGYYVLNVRALGELHRILNDRLRHQALLAEWRQTFDAVIIDCPSFGAGEPGVYTPLVASATEALLMIAMPAVTESHVMEEAIKWLADSGAELSGVILNDIANPTLAQEFIRESKRFQRFGNFIPRFVENKISRWGPLNRYH